MKNGLLILLIIFSLAEVRAQGVSLKDIMRVKKAFEISANIRGEDLVSTIPLLLNDDTVALVFNYPHAFVAVSTYEYLPAVKAYSYNNNMIYSGIGGHSSYDFLKADYKSFIDNIELHKKEVAKNRLTWRGQLFEKDKAQYGPLLSSLFGQVNCRDENNKLINVTNLYTPNNYAVGCVAITFTATLHYFKWPRIGTGSHSYSDNSGSTRGSHSVNYEASYINWTNILDEYNKKPSTAAQRMELGRLAYNCAVAVNMDFEYNGSTSNINRIPAAANKYFRYTARYINKNNPQFWAVVDSNIINSLPVQFAIYTPSGGGHAVVGDGLKYQNQGTRYYHLNMGWWGSSNGWYNIQGSFNAGGYTNITAAVVDMVPVPEMGKPKLNPENKTVELEWFYSQSITPESYELQVKEGNANWVTLANDIKGRSYSYKYDSEDLHRFRVRAKYDGKWPQNGWSQYENINIKEALNDFYPEQAKIYPTLASEKIIIEYKYLSGSKIAVYNASGTMVYYEDIAEDANLGKRIIPVGTLTSGMYFVRVYGQASSTAVKFVKL